MDEIIEKANEFAELCKEKGAAFIIYSKNPEEGPLSGPLGIGGSNDELTAGFMLIGETLKAVFDKVDSIEAAAEQERVGETISDADLMSFLTQIMRGAD